MPPYPSVLVHRSDALCKLASRLGFALRRAGLSGSDTIRFLSPIADVLEDIGDEMAHVRRRHPVSGAPSRVHECLGILGAVACRDPIPFMAGCEVVDGPIALSLDSFSSRVPVVVSLADALGIVAPSAPVFVDVGIDPMVSGLNCIWCGLWQPSGLCLECGKEVLEVAQEYVGAHSIKYVDVDLVTYTF